MALRRFSVWISSPRSSAAALGAKHPYIPPTNAGRERRRGEQPIRLIHAGFMRSNRYALTNGPNAEMNPRLSSSPLIQPLKIHKKIGNKAEAAASEVEKENINEKEEESNLPEV